jgi:SAM-dependent methyltransferase
MKKILSAIRRRIVKPRLASYGVVKKLVAGKHGLEVGGPTELFKRGNLLPVYAIAAGLDNCNFTQQTIWEGTIHEGQTFVYDPRHAPGRQYIVEARDLGCVAADSYDFVLSSHTLEHIANPLGALSEWMRTLKDGGALILIVPHKDGTFDHRRPVTKLSHLIEDYERGTTEEDLTHLPEILRCHDLALDPPAGDFEAFKARSERNFENRCLHHHVFDTNLVVEVMDRLDMQIVAVEPFLLHHILVVGRKNRSRPLANARFMGAQAAYRRSSPFHTDRSLSV